MTLKDPCPLGCGRSWHGLPREPYGHILKACPGPYGVTPKVLEEVVEHVEVPC